MESSKKVQLTRSVEARRTFRRSAEDTVAFVDDDFGADEPLFDRKKVKVSSVRDVTQSAGGVPEQQEDKENEKRRGNTETEGKEMKSKRNESAVENVGQEPVGRKQGMTPEEENQLDVESMFEPNLHGKEWFFKALNNVFAHEIASVEKTCSEKVVNRVRDMLARVEQKLRTIPEAQLELGFSASQQNPKNAALEQNKQELIACLAGFTDELEDLRRLERERTAEMSVALPTSRQAESKLTEQVLVGESTDLGERLTAAIAQVAFANAKLRQVDRLAAQAGTVSSRLTKICHDQAFQSFRDINEPAKLIKALTTKNVP